ncbi:MAG: response regulator [Omnitrophica bacterium]|nr:response regulator [Candidatus Omnitrophota bacterium]
MANLEKIRVLGQKKILLVDDEEDFCFFLKKNLEKSKEFNVLTATNAKEGVRLAKKEKPNLILLDLVMPKIPGNEMAEILSKDLQTKDIPIVFLTAVVTEDEMALTSTGKIGGQNFIAKTIGTEKIISYIREHFK